MWKTTARRLLILIPQLLFISIFIFILQVNMPGDAFNRIIDPTLPLEEIQRLRDDMGLNDPMLVRYGNFMSGLVRGDFGMSFLHFRPVSEVIGERIWVTFFLSLYTVVLIYLIAIPLGIIAGRRSGTIIDKSILIYLFVATAMPTVVLAILMMFWFSPVGLGWFPLGGAVDAFVYGWGTNFEIFINRIYHMTLPAITGALLGTISIVFMLRANIIERKASDYVIFARSKGVPTRTIFSKHILRNSIIPIAAFIGMVITGLFGGSIFIERIFQIPGIGLLFLDSINLRDFPVANVIILFFAAMTALGVLLSDIILSIVDPRIRIK